MFPFVAASTTQPVLDLLNSIIHFKFAGNEIWRFAAVFAVVLAALIAGRILRYFLDQQIKRLEKREEKTLLAALIKSIVQPAQLAILAKALLIGKAFVRFAPPDQPGAGLTSTIEGYWIPLCNALFAVALAWWFYKLVDIIELYLLRWADKTETKLDDMLIPVIRKALRITIAIIAALFILQNVLDQKVTTILAGLGVGGLAVAIAARDTIANFFGSLTIFTDRPFHVGDRVRIENYDGFVEEVGFRSTRLRTLEGHLVTVPNANVTNTSLENISRRPYIRRKDSITVTYDTPPAKIERACQIIRNILNAVPELNGEPELMPRVYFDRFNDWALNIVFYYWLKPPDWWRFLQIGHEVNIAIMKAFEQEGIEFAFPTQTLYLKQESSDNPDTFNEPPDQTSRK